jgi:hypothetical protein
MLALGGEGAGLLDASALTCSVGMWRMPVRSPRPPCAGWVSGSRGAGGAGCAGHLHGRCLSILY